MPATLNLRRGQVVGDASRRAINLNTVSPASPVFIGDPRAPTPPPGDNDTSIATTAFVTAAITAAPNKTITLSGDVSGSGTAAISTTLPVVNSNIGTWNNVTINAKGLATAGLNVAYVTGGPYLATGGGTMTGTLAMSSNNITGAGAINAQAVYANNVLLTSDASLKRDIEGLPACLPLVAAIEPRSYRMELPPMLVRHIDGTEESVPQEARRGWGFVAQEVEAAAGPQFPGVEIGSDGLRSLSYSDLTAVLWKALQEAIARIKALEARL